MRRLRRIVRPVPRLRRVRTGRLDERGGKYTRCSLVLLAPLMNARPRRSLHGAGIIGNSLLKYRQDVLSVLNHVTCHDAQLVYLR